MIRILFNIIKTLLRKRKIKKIYLIGFIIIMGVFFPDILLQLMIMFVNTIIDSLMNADEGNGFSITFNLNFTIEIQVSIIVGLVVYLFTRGDDNDDDINNNNKDKDIKDNTV